MTGIRHSPLALLLLEGGACRSLAGAGPAALDVHMIRMTLVIGIIDTLHRLTVDADRLAGMDYGTLERIPALPLLHEALAAGAVTAAGMLPSHHDISLAAQMLLLIVVGTVLHRTFQIRHICLLFTLPCRTAFPPPKQRFGQSAYAASFLFRNSMSILRQYIRILNQTVSPVQQPMNRKGIRRDIKSAFMEPAPEASPAGSPLL